MPDSQQQWILSGSELSPFHLKVAAMLRFKGISYRDFPNQGGFLENLRVIARTKLLKAGVFKLTYPVFTELDEFPLAPFLFGPNGENLYDSSAIAVWLDKNTGSNKDALVKFCGNEKINFLIQLVDEYFDEFGLYMVHHARWKISAKDNNAGQRLANEMSSFAGPFFKPLIAKFFSARQVRRCPYLLSVAPEGYWVEGLSNERQPPSRNGFPATHELLEESYLNIIKALEPIFATRPYLFGQRFTLADASVYGQLGMNLTDPTAAIWIKDNAPSVYHWLNRVYQGDFSENKGNSEFIVDEFLQPLFTEIVRVFYPLMKLNESAYEQHRKAGEMIFNEDAFWKEKSLYNGDLDGHHFTSVAKTFQVKTWRNLKKVWGELDKTARSELVEVFSNIDPV